MRMTKGDTVPSASLRGSVDRLPRSCNKHTRSGGASVGSHAHLEGHLRGDAEAAVSVLRFIASFCYSSRIPFPDRGSADPERILHPSFSLRRIPRQHQIVLFLKTAQRCYLRIAFWPLSDLRKFDQFGQDIPRLLLASPLGCPSLQASHKTFAHSSSSLAGPLRCPASPLWASLPPSLRRIACANLKFVGRDLMKEENVA